MVRFKLYHIRSLIGYRTSAAGLPASSGDARALHFKTCQMFMYIIHIQCYFIISFAKKDALRIITIKLSWTFTQAYGTRCRPEGTTNWCRTPRRVAPGCSSNDAFFPSWRRFAMKSLSALLAFVTGIHQTSVNSHHKGLVMRSFDVFFVLAWTINWTKSRVAGDLRRLTYATLIVLPLCCHYWRIVTKINLYIYISMTLGIVILINLMQRCTENLISLHHGSYF